MENYFWQYDVVSFQEQPLDFFVLSETEKNHILTKKGFNNQITYAILLKYFESERQFPEEQIECLPYAYETLVEQLDISFEKFKWPTERLLKSFRASIREFLGYRERPGVRRSTIWDSLRITHMQIWNITWPKAIDSLSFHFFTSNS